jgi:hypothetical protein
MQLDTFIFKTIKNVSFSYNTEQNATDYCFSYFKPNFLFLSGNSAQKSPQDIIEIM